jgi:uncharacterized membrane protein YhiD involved in acid resistance
MEAVNFKDIIKKSFTQLNFSSTLSISDIAIVLFVTLLIGMFIFYTYKKTFQGILYTQSFNVSLVMVAIVTSLVIMTISSNFILSLGMVGALSIVRFRTAIKDPMDIVFMFWAIAVGIANGAGFFKISIVGSIFIGVILFILTKYKTTSTPYLLILNYVDKGHDEIINHLKNELKDFRIKAKTITNQNVELTLEIRIDDEDTSFVNRLSKLDGVKNAVLVSYNGDYVS